MVTIYSTHADFHRGAHAQTYTPNMYVKSSGAE